MNSFKKALYHYVIGVLISASIVFMAIIYDYYFNGYYDYPQFDNFLIVCLISGLGFGLTHYVFALFQKSKKNKKYK